MERRGLV